MAYPNKSCTCTKCKQYFAVQDRAASFRPIDGYAVAIAALQAQNGVPPRSIATARDPYADGIAALRAADACRETDATPTRAAIVLPVDGSAPDSYARDLEALRSAR